MDGGLFSERHMNDVEMVTSTLKRRAVTAVQDDPSIQAGSIVPTTGGDLFELTSVHRVHRGFLLALEPRRSVRADHQVG